MPPAAKPKPIARSATNAAPTADHRRSLASAAEALEDYYRTIADSMSLKALKEAPAALEPRRQVPTFERIPCRPG